MRSLDLLVTVFFGLTQRSDLEISYENKGKPDKFAGIHTGLLSPRRRTLKKSVASKMHKKSTFDIILSRKTTEGKNHCR